MSRFPFFKRLAPLSLAWLVATCATHAQTAESPHLSAVLATESGLSKAVIARDFARRLSQREVPLRGYSLGKPRRSRSRRAAVEHFSFRPALDGIPLLNGNVRVHVDAIGRVVRASGHRQLVEPITRAFAIEASDSATRAREEVRVNPNTAAQVEQVYFVQGDVPLPAWRVYLETPEQGAFEVVISAITGDALRVTPLTHDAGSSTGAVFEAPATAHPLVGPRSLESLSGWPVDEGTCPTDLYPSGAPGECWTDGAATIGANADVCLDINADNICDSRAFGAGGVFNSLFVDSYDQAGDPVPDRDAAMVNAFYWVNALHDWLYRLGFDEASGNFQAVDAVIVDVQDGAVTNNATFSTPPDGIAPRMQLGLYPWSLRDSAFDGDIIVHEYAHGVTTRLVGGPSDVAALSLWQSGALGEGWSDVLAASFTGDPVIGEYVANNPASGIRTAALDTSPYTFGRLGSLSGAIHGPTGRILPLPEVHADGEIWSAVLWAVREQIGKDDFEQTLIDALKLTPVRPSMIEARDAFIQAAGLLGVGGPDACQVWVAFAARGLGASAALNPTEATQPNDTALSVLESYDKSVICGGAPPTVLENLLTETAEADNGWQASGLWHRSTRKAAEGAYSWWFGQESTGDYNTGARVVGDLVSPPIDLTGSAAVVLSWDQYFSGEGFNSRIDLGGVWAPYLNADSGRVWVSTDDGDSWLLITHIAHDTPGQDFVSFAVNLTRFAGSVIRLRFDFDTFTASDNANEGWFVDNIRVNRTSTAPMTLTTSPAALAFIATAGAIGPPSQDFEVEITGTGDLSWSATVQPAVPWLSISLSNGVGPTVLSVSVSTDGLPSGVFTGSIEISASESASVTMPVTLSVAATPGAVASWSFEEGDSGPGVTITDGSDSGLHGITVGLGSAAVDGVVGRARFFNGFADGVIAPVSATYTPQKFTVQAWIRLDAYPSSLGVIVSTFGGASMEGWYLAVNSAGKPVLMAATTPASAPWLTGPANVQLGRWHRIIATYNQLTHQAALYLDGQLQASMQFPGLTTSLTTPLTIGKASWTESYHLKGTVDEIAILPYIQSAFSVAVDFASAAPPAPVANVSVGGQWNFDGSLVDASGNGHTAIAQDSDFGPGVIGNGLRFDGFNDSVTIVNDELLSPTSFTVSAWVRLLALSPGWGALISNYDGAFAGWYLGVLGDGKPFLGLASLPTSLPSVVGGEPIGVGEWSRLTATYDGSSRTLSLYVNGVLAASRKILGLTPRVSGNLVLGKASWADSHHTAFDLDELVILPRAQTPQEVTADFQSYAGSSDLALARWSLDETDTGPGTVFGDAASGHDATTAGNRNSPVTGISGVARRFEGYPDHAVAEPHSDFSSESFSFSTWVRLDESLDKWGVLFSTYDGISSGWYLGVSADRRPILSVSGSPGSSPWLLASQVLELGQWHHVAVTFEGRERRGVIYVDAVRSASAIFSAWQPSVGVSPHFGRASWANAAYLRSILDEPILRGYELTAAEVAAEHSTGATRQNPQPQARWEFEETDTGRGVILADVVGDHDATTLGTGGAVRSGVSGVYARDFSGAPNAAQLQPDALFAADAFSFSVWLYLDSSPSQWGMIFSNYDGDYRGWYVALNTDGRLILSVSGQPSFNPWLLSTGTVAAGQWVHVAVTFDGVNRRGAIYLDGVLSGTAVFPAWTPQQIVGPVFARASWDNRYYLDLSIDDARFYDVELSATEISDLSSLP